MENWLLITSPLQWLYCWAWVRFFCSLMIYIKPTIFSTGHLTHDFCFQQENSDGVKADIGESLSWTKKIEKSEEKS